MSKKINQIISHGIVLTILATLPMVWSALPCNEASAGEVELGPGASPVHAIPANKEEIKNWFEDTIIHATDRSDLVKNELVEAEEKPETITVRQDGSGEFKTIKEALEAAKGKGRDTRVVIDVGPGFYNERITIDRPYVTLYGDPNNKPQIVFDASTAKIGLPKDTATLLVKSQYFIAASLQIENVAELKDDEEGFAVSLMSNYSAFYDCTMGSKKTVINDDQGSHFFKNCIIDGGSTLIVGGGRSIYLESTIHVRQYEPASVVAGQGRSSPDPREGGFVFAHCSVVGDAGAKALLAHTGLPYARVLFAYSELTNVVQPEGWLAESEDPNQVTGFFGEFSNYGAGADISQRINRECTEKLTDAALQPLLTLDFIYASKWLLPAPQVVPQVAPQVVPQVAPQVVPEVVPQDQLPQVTPQDQLPGFTR